MLQFSLTKKATNLYTVIWQKILGKSASLVKHTSRGGNFWHDEGMHLADNMTKEKIMHKIQ